MTKKLILSLFTISALVGCNNDDDSKSTPTLVGKWKAIKFEYYKDGVFEYTENIVDDNPTCPDYIEFKKDGSYISIENDENCNTTSDEAGVYTSNETTITTTVGGYTEVTTIISLTNTDLKTDFTETSSQSGSVYKSVGYFKKIN